MTISPAPAGLAWTGCPDVLTEGVRSESWGECSRQSLKCFHWVSLFHWVVEGVSMFSLFLWNKPASKLITVSVDRWLEKQDIVQPHNGTLLSCFSHVWLCATPQTAAYQAPPSLGFSRQEHWSGLQFPSPVRESEREVTQSCPTLSDPLGCSLPGSSAHGIFQARVLEWGAIAFSE